MTEDHNTTQPLGLASTAKLGQRHPECSSLCAADEPCSVSSDGKCIGWWSDEAWEASAQIGAEMDEKYLAFGRYLSHPDGSAQRRVEWRAWETARNRQHAAQALFAAATAGGPNVVAKWAPAPGCDGAS